MAFDDVRLPENIEKGAEGGPRFNTSVITMSGGQEQRIQNWSRARAAYTIGYDLSDTDWQDVRAFFYARRGRARGFRFKDWTDYKARRQVVLNLNGTLQLARTYADAIGLQYVRQITRLVPGTLRLYDDNATDFTGNYNVNHGTLTETSGNVYPPNLVGNLYADFEFDIPCRFDSDEFVLTAETPTATSVAELTIIELIENAAQLNGN